MTDLTFVYFKMRALGEAPQMMLHYRNQPYRHMMSWEYFGKPWPDAKRSAAFRQLPMLVTEDGVQITQTGAIMRYLAGRLDLMPPDPLAAAQADEVFEGAHELFQPLNPPVNFHTGDQFAAYLIDAFDTLYEEGATAPKMMSIGLHCRLIGRPARFAGLVKFLDHVQRYDHVWLARRIDIARHWREHHPYDGAR